MICPVCKKEFSEPPAISRYDNVTKICSDCGTKEALEIHGASEETKKAIIEIIEKVKMSKGKNQCQKK